MTTPNFGLSNAYLKLGAALVLTSLIALAFTSFFSVDRELQALVRNAGGLALLSGAVVYVIGRFVQAMSRRAQV